MYRDSPLDGPGEYHVYSQRYTEHRAGRLTMDIIKLWMGDSYSLLARIRHLRGEPRSRSPNTRTTLLRAASIVIIKVEIHKS